MEFVKDVYESFVAINGWTMLFAWCNLLIVYLLLKKFLFKPVKKMIDSRQNEVDGMYADAERAQAEAERMREEYEEKISRAEEESEEILRTAGRRAQLRSEEIISEAEREAARTLERASEQIELEKRQALNEVKDSVAEMAIGIAAAVIERDVSESEHKALIDDFIESVNFDKMEIEQFRSKKPHVPSIYDV